MNRGIAVFGEMSPGGVGSPNWTVGASADPTAVGRTTACGPAVGRLESCAASTAGDGLGLRADSIRQHSPPFVTDGRSVATLQHSIPQPPAAAQRGTVASVIAKAVRTNRVFMVCQFRIALHRRPSALTRIVRQQDRCHTPNRRSSKWVPRATDAGRRGKRFNERQRISKQFRHTDNLSARRPRNAI